MRIHILKQTFVDLVVFLILEYDSIRNSRSSGRVSYLLFIIAELNRLMPATLQLLFPALQFRLKLLIIFFYNLGNFVIHKTRFVTVSINHNYNVTIS